MNFGNVGYVVVTIFVVSWIGALLIYRHKQYEKKGAGAFKVGTRQTGGAPISAPAVVIEAARTTGGTSQNAGTGNSGV